MESRVLQIVVAILSLPKIGLNEFLHLLEFILQWLAQLSSFP